jgi:hypothetical protein
MMSSPERDKAFAGLIASASMTVGWLIGKYGMDATPVDPVIWLAKSLKQCEVDCTYIDAILEKEKSLRTHVKGEK